MNCHRYRQPQPSDKTTRISTVYIQYNYNDDRNVLCIGRLTAGVDNILLHYLSLEAGQGVWLGPTHHTSSTYGTLHSEMIQCFHATCSAIRDILLAKTDVRILPCDCGFGANDIHDPPQEELDEDDDWISDEEEAEIELENVSLKVVKIFSQ